ncbi:hypothetical protein [Portibacter marinus]|uniref:hypothetical protein n=1 Tax=Portibacter marinus TaxID=2898660 RepID=UPI001F172588|nr:hypothetical protein [Portibacter marinus]
MKTYPIYSLLLVSLMLIACVKDEKQASNSIEGLWQVNEMITIYAYDNGGFLDEDVVEEQGDLGSFDFGENIVDYEFIRNDTLFSGQENWTLSTERVNEGFIRVTKFTLKVGERFEFDVAFGDQTKNAEKNATEMRLIQMPGEQEEVYFQMMMEKE